jgi:hypothetical protein
MQCTHTNLGDATALLEQVVLNVSTHHTRVLVEVQLHELSETGRVVVVGGLGVTEGLQGKDSII